MKVVNQYIIPFAGLKEGEHEFRFGFGQQFFDEHEILEALKGDIEAVVRLNKTVNLLTLEIGIRGNLELRCDKCLDFFSLPVQYNGTLVVKFGDDVNAATDEIWILHPAEHELNLEQHLFECIGLCIPIQRVHPENSDGRPGCNPEMLKLLNSHSVDASKVSEYDPRWNKLKTIINNINTN